MLNSQFTGQIRTAMQMATSGPNDEKGQWLAIAMMDAVAELCGQRPPALLPHLRLLADAIVASQFCVIAAPGGLYFSGQNADGVPQYCRQWRDALWIQKPAVSKIWHQLQHASDCEHQAFTLRELHRIAAARSARKRADDFARFVATYFQMPLRLLNVDEESP